MGLDNGFELRKMNDPNFCVQMSHFRNYYELRDWMKEHCCRVYEDSDEEYYVTKEALLDLLAEVTKVIDVLRRYTDREIAYFDDHGYGKVKNIRKIYGNAFTPQDSISAFAGHKAVHLYTAVESMIEILEIDEFEKQSLYFTFYNSY